MVNLPDSPKPRGRRSRQLRRRNHMEISRSRDSSHLHMKEEPKSLLEIEDQAKRTVALMEKYSPKSEKNYFVAMDLLRLQYNLVSMFIYYCKTFIYIFFLSINVDF